MAVFFSSLDMLRLALISGVVPPEVSLAPVAAAILEDGLWIEPSVPLPKNATVELRRLGVEFSKEQPSAPLVSFTCWPQLLPLVPVDASVNITHQTPVLFELRPASLLAEVVGEILRLGNDRQAYRWLGAVGSESESALLRVIGPPYYTLLRACDKEDHSLAARAYFEGAPNVWLQIGHTHPLAQHLKLPPGQMLLLQPPRNWIAIAEAPFRDIYEILEFPLPSQPIGWQDSQPPSRLTVKLQLTSASSDDPAELWVLRDRGFEQVDDLVRNADDGLIARLAFAMAESNGQSTVVIRARPSKESPPVLVLLGQSFRPYLKLPNLFVPCGTRLQPPLRRDAVRRLLCEDLDRVTWLYPGANGEFTPESLPDSSFRPLSDWVDYVLHHERVALEQWIEETTFDFEPFVCKDDDRGANPKAKKKEGAEKRPRRAARAEEVSGAAADVVGTAAKKKGHLPEDLLPELPATSPSEVQQLLQELEQRFLSLEGPIDAPERVALWPQLAQANAAFGHPADAALCWLQALWQETPDAPRWAQSWCRSEYPSGVEADDIAAVLEKGEPSSADVRGVAAWLANSGHRNEAVPTPLLGTAQRFLEQHEGLLPVRAAWLAAVGAFQLSRGDVLGLTRTRDRLLERMFDKGLTHDQDLPTFLRFSGLSHSDRIRAFRNWLLTLPERMARWVQKYRAVSEPEPRDTIAYGQLMLALGLARLGEASAAERLASAAESWLSESEVEDKDVHIALKDAFRYRIQQALESKPASGPLPTEVLEFTGELSQFARYKVDHLRMRSRILEPHEKINAYRNYRGRLQDFDKALNELVDILDRTRLEGECRRLLDMAKNSSKRLAALKAILALSPRLGEAFAVPLLGEAIEVGVDQVDIFEHAQLLENALLVAAHFDQVDAVQRLLGRLHEVLGSEKVAAAPNRLEGLIGQCFRGLRKLGMQEGMRGLLQALTTVITRGKPLASLRKGVDWPKLVRVLLHVAAGHFYFNNEMEARPLIEEARLVLLHGDLERREQAELACTYITALGQAPVALALHAIDELLDRLGRVFDNFSTYTHYSASKLEVIEAIVLTVITEEFAMGQVARRWLEDDEFLVRKRIHRDVEEALRKRSDA
jgi:hypothetical protein